MCRVPSLATHIHTKKMKQIPSLFLKLQALPSPMPTSVIVFNIPPLTLRKGILALG
jgi:hypothetical protein